MKTLKLFLVLACAITTACVVMGLAMQKAPARPEGRMQEQRFHVRGEVRGLEADSIRIKHEEIPNYMAAMTMPFEVRNAALLRGLRVGDEIGFELVVTKDDSWIASIQKLSESAAPASATLLNAVEAQPLQSGETVPDFILTNQRGEPVRLSDYRGKALLVTFIYTRCPIPNFCPLMSKNFASLQERLQKRFPGKFQLLSVTIDPAFDTPAVLKEYAARYSRNDSTWTFATGSPEQTDAVGALFGLIQEREGGLINHDLRTALIGPDGRLVHVWKSNVWTPYEIERRMIDVGF
jgi:protein SCO1